MPDWPTAVMTDPDSGCRARLALGAYLLGGLPAAEADAMREHLASCLPCRAEHDRLACLPSWLSLLSADDFPPASAAAEGTQIAHDPGGGQEPHGESPA
jgi:Putative zinc-finger